MPAAPRPITRYPGSKFKDGVWLTGFFPPHRVYVSAFAGSAGDLLHKPRSRTEVLNDRDGEIVNLLRVLRDPKRAARLAELVALTPYARDEYESAFRGQSTSQLERARRYLVQTVMGASTKGTLGRVGFDARMNRDAFTARVNYWRDWPDAVPSFVERLRGVVIENHDALAVMRRYDSPHTLHYADPPYVPEARRSGMRYQHEFSAAQHRLLLKTARQLQGYVIVSGYENSLYERLLERHGWLKVCKPVVTDNGGRALECLWLCPKTVASRGELFRYCA